MSKDTWMAMVAHNDTSFPDLADFVMRLRAAWPAAPAIDSLKQQGNLATFRLGEAVAALTLFPHAIPAQYLQGPCECAWYWPAAAASMAAHRAHLLVALLDEGRDALEKSFSLMRLTQSAVQVTNSSGVFWGPGRLVHSPPAFLEAAASATRETLPLYAWVDFRVEPVAGGALRLFTTGLTALDIREIEVPCYFGTAQSLREAAYNIAHYLLDGVKPLGDGDTIGLPNTAEITAFHDQSMLDGETPVFRLEFA